MEQHEKPRWKCVVCGEILEGEEKPSRCPVCGAGAESIVPYTEGEQKFVSTDPFNIVVLGGGVAAFNAIDAIRQRSTAAKITMISREKSLPYYRPTVTKKLAMHGTAADSLIKPQSWYDERNVDVRLDTTVTQIDANGKKVTLDSGDTLGYDKLIIALGASSFILPIPGADLPQVVALREYSDVEKLHTLLGDTPKNVAVIGGGLLGLETAWNLCRLKHKVTVLETFPNILPRQIDPEGSPLLMNTIEAHCKVMLGVSVEAIDADHGKVAAVRLKDGTQIPCEVVILSTGVRSNIKIAEAAGVATDKAIVVDNHMRTNLPDIFAAGDCAICNGRFDGLWETAKQQGITAGANCLGDESVTFSSKLAGATFAAFGTNLFAVGDLGLDKAKTYQTISARDEIRKTYRKFFFVDRHMTGGVLLGNVALTPQTLKGATEHVSSDEAFDLGLN